MATVIEFELKRKSKPQSKAPVDGAGQIIIFNGVRVERLETVDAPEADPALGENRRNIAG